MKNIATCALALTLGFLSRSALAWDCATVTPSTSVSATNITLSRDLPVGAVIGSQVITPTINAFSCYDSAQGVISNQTLGVRALGTFDSVISGRRVYKTGVEGVGYAISGSSANCGGVTNTVTGSNTIRGDINTVKLCENTKGMIAAALSGTLTITFYKTATETGSGTVSGGSLGALMLLNNSLLLQSPEAEVRLNPFAITTPACKMTQTILPVDMKEVDRKAFSGKGSTPGDAYTQSFALPMLCNAGTQVSVKMEGDIFDAGKGIINTTGGINAASGVGIQLLYNNQPMLLGSEVGVGSSVTGGSFSVPLKARYYQTGDRISSGTANGVLSFTLTYQ